MAVLAEACALRRETPQSCLSPSAAWPFPVSIMTFSDLPPVLATALAERGYEKPTEVQAAVLAPEAAGRDLVVSAQTGSSTRRPSCR